jgi:hypothetical protein
MGLHPVKTETALEIDLALWEAIENKVGCGPYFAGRVLPRRYR